MNAPATRTELARELWQSRYRFTDAAGVPEPDIEASWARVARALSAVEPREQDAWQRRFFDALSGFKLLPGGRILAGAGTGRSATLFNCFVMGAIEDSIGGIFRALHESALTMHRGGGVGLDFSTLRPRGSTARQTGTTASGPVSFMQVWDAMCATVLSTGARRGAMMATLRCDHPDILEFIAAKRAPGALRHFNLSVLVTDAFMEAVREGVEWPLVFPVSTDAGVGESVICEWPGHPRPVRCRVHRRIPARELWNRLLESSYACAEPGVLFVDRINRLNNLSYRERLSATNPCGEVPLPAYGACDLASLNLPQFVRDPFGPDRALDEEALAATAAIGVRMLDDVIDASPFPLPQQAKVARAARRIGLGITGLADALIMLGLRYDSDAGRAMSARVMRLICHAAYGASAALAQEKGAFPAFNRKKYLLAPFIHALPTDLLIAIAQNGIRNSHLIAIAPAGTISLLAHNVSSGIEPVFAASYDRKVQNANGGETVHRVTDYAVNVWREQGQAGLPPAFVSAADVSPEAHIGMLGALQPYVDNAIAKTINVAASTPFARFAGIYDAAFAAELKGVTAFRPNATTGAVLAERPEACGHAPWSPEREAD